MNPLMKPILKSVPSPQRDPLRSECVDHLDHNPANNDPANLRILRYQIGGAPLENHDRSVYQSTHSTNGRAELPYTEARAWAEVVRDGLA